MYKHFNKKLQVHHYHRPKQTRCRAIKKWCSKWNQFISVLIAFAIFIALLSLVIYNINCEHMHENYNEIKAKNYRILKEAAIETQAKCFVPNTVNNNTITCEYFNETNLNTLPQSLSYFTNQGNYSILVLKYVQFIYEKIDKSWLKDTKLPISTLEIISCDLTDLGEDAFNRTPFENLQIVKFYNTKIVHLKRESFLNTQIEEFIFMYSYGAKKGVNIEAKFLEGMANTLTTLAFKHSLIFEESLRNLTGVNSVHLPKLTTLDLRYNRLKKITNKSFTNCLNLEVLDLSSNSIRTIDYDSFQLPKLKFLDLSNNLLTTLAEGVFDSINAGLILIKHNNWNCNCDLLWFKYFFEYSYDELFANIEFLCNDRIPYWQVIFCDNDTLTSTANQDLTTPIPIPNWIDCDLPIITTGHDVLHFSHKIPIRNNTIVFNFYQISDLPKYVIQIDGGCQMNYLLWKNSNNQSDIGCLLIVAESIEISLKYEQTYTLCLLEQGIDTVSPFDCTSLTVPPEWSSRTWLANNKQPLVISLLCSTILITIISSCLITFYCIRQHPKLIKGNKRVIIVGNKTTDAIILPKTYQQTNYIPPSFNSYSDGYLTPKTNFYETNHHYYNGPALSTISEKSLESIYADLESNDSVNYGLGKTLEKCQMIHRPRLEHVCSINENIYEAPPPLPPNHPSEQLY